MITPLEETLKFIPYYRRFEDERKLLRLRETLCTFFNNDIIVKLFYVFYRATDFGVSLKLPKVYHNICESIIFFKIRIWMLHASLLYKDKNIM